MAFGIKTSSSGKSSSSKGGLQVTAGGGDSALSQVDQFINGPSAPTGKSGDGSDSGGPTIIHTIRDLLFGKQDLPGAGAPPAIGVDQQGPAIQIPGQPVTSAGDPNITEDPTKPAGQDNGILGKIAGILGITG